MSDLIGLENGYAQLLGMARNELDLSYIQVCRLRILAIKIMFLSHLFDGNDPKNAFKAVARLVLA